MYTQELRYILWMERYLINGELAEIQRLMRDIDNDKRCSYSADYIYSYALRQVNKKLGIH